MPAPQVFVIGDSISIQYGPHLQGYLEAAGWGYQRKGGDEDIEAESDDPLRGANGGDSRRVRAYLEYRRERGDFAPDLLLLNCGLHDLKLPFASDQRQVPLAEYADHLAAILALVPETTQPVWVRTTPVDEVVHAERKDFQRLESDVAAYNAAADAVMVAAGIAVIDLHTFSTGFGRAALAADGVHFDASVRPLQAAFIAGALAQIWAGRG